jgi:hypothetical protein
MVAAAAREGAAGVDPATTDGADALAARVAAAAAAGSAGAAGVDGPVFI